MFGLLARCFIKNSNDVNDPRVREAYGTLSGIFGIVLNVILFGAKYFAGAVTGSVSIIADALNNLSDAGSSVVMLFGFRMAGQRAHSDHPFGHGRWEYISGLLVSMLIMMMGFSMAKESVQKIISPESVEFGLLPAAILVVSVLVKLYMCLYNRRLAQKIDSVAVKATAMDSLSDACATAAVLAAMVAGHFLGIPIDGYTGVLVSLMILWAGFSAARDTISPLLGNPPDRQLVEQIISIVRSNEIVTGVHDLVVHDYGVRCRMVTLHAEVPADGDLIEIHDVIDLIEHELCEKLCCHAVIHMDPIAMDDGRVAAVRSMVIEALHEKLDAGITVHDFRMVEGPTHTNVVFDAVLPFELKLDASEAKAKIAEIVRELDGNFYAVVTIDNPYV